MVAGEALVDPRGPWHRGPEGLGADVRDPAGVHAPRGQRRERGLRHHLRVREVHHPHLPGPRPPGARRVQHLAVHLEREPQPQVPRRHGAGADRASECVLRHGAPDGCRGLPGGPRRDSEAQDARPAVPDDEPAERHRRGGEADLPPPHECGPAPPARAGPARDIPRRALRAGQRVVREHDEHGLRAGRRPRSCGDGVQPDDARRGGHRTGRGGRHGLPRVRCEHVSEAPREDVALGHPRAGHRLGARRVREARLGGRLHHRGHRGPPVRDRGPTLRGAVHAGLPRERPHEAGGADEHQEFER
mmetsp:Transcript_21716/g.64683  ORF Transcript_21716/g.64683 Transcript_21716/m.64683 type:complete len:303 (-) Transcript_21716:628-1536(-)